MSDWSKEPQMPKIQLKDLQNAIKVGKEVLPMVQPYK